MQSNYMQPNKKEPMARRVASDTIASKATHPPHGTKKLKTEN